MSSDETAARKPIGIMSVPPAERLEAIRVHWEGFDFSGTTDFDRERDQIIGFLLDQVDSLRDRMAAYVERESADAAAGSYAGRAEKAEAEAEAMSDRLMAIDDALREAGVEYPIGVRGVRDLATQRDGQRARAMVAEAERDEARARLAEVGDGHEWAIRCQIDGTDYYEGPYDDEQQARESGNFFNPGWRLVARPVGGWREVEEGGERG